MGRYDYQVNIQVYRNIIFVAVRMKLFSKHTLLAGTWPVNRIKHNTTHIILLELVQPKHYSGLSTKQTHIHTLTQTQGKLASNQGFGGWKNHATLLKQSFICY